MREIIFRGKRLDNREWYYGSYLFLHISSVDWTGSKRGKPEDVHYIVNDQDINYAVSPSTVGQYTGLKDKNGKRIFEGDLVQYNTFDDFSCCSAVKFGEYDQDGSSGEYTPSVCVGWYVEVCGFTCPDWAEDDPIFFKDCQKQQNLLEVNEMCEVIGNIHDDIDLLGGKFYDNE